MKVESAWIAGALCALLAAGCGGAEEDARGAEEIVEADYSAQGVYPLTKTEDHASVGYDPKMAAGVSPHVLFNLMRTQDGMGGVMRRMREFSEAMRDVETYDDPMSAAGQVELSSFYEHAWRLNDGSYVLTNDSSFNPYAATGQDGVRLEATP